MIESLIIWIRFLTRIPLPFRGAWSDRAFVRGLILAPLVGLLVGAILAAVHYLAGLTGKPLIAPLLTVAAGIVVTGGLHLDGLADTCDGIFSNREREGMLEIMRDSRIGTNGTLALIMALLSKAALLSLLDPAGAWRIILVMPVPARMAIAWSAGFSRYARSGGGLGKALIDGAGIRHAVMATFLSTLVVLFFLHEKGIAGIIAVVVCTMALTVYAGKKLGGITGDVLGAVIETAEIAFLLTMVVYET